MTQPRDSVAAGPLASPERRAALRVLLWLVVLALISLFVSVPFRLVSPSGGLSDAHAIYLNGLLVATTAFVALMASDAFALREARPATAAVVLWAALAASALAGAAGVLDALFGGTSLIALALMALLALGVSLVALTAGLMLRAAKTRRTRDWAAAMAALTGVGAVFMAYVASWILTFGDWPRALVHGYPALVGITTTAWLGQLATGYAHLMPAAIVVLATSAAASALPAKSEGGIVVRVGLLWLTAAIILCALIYMVSGFSVAQPPIFFESGPAGLNGLWAGDLEVAIGVFLGALVTLAGLLRERLPGGAERWAAALVAALLFVLLAGIGSYVELHESLYGLGALTAPRAAQNAAYTWFIQDVGWLFLPALLAIVSSLRQFGAAERTAAAAALLLAAGGVVALVGGLVSVFAAPAPTGAGFVVTGIGLLAALAGALRGVGATGLGRTRRPAHVANG